MKISVIITTVLVAQVSASFFDVFNGAVLSVQNSFGKLLSDVVTDVKETVDCTILALEHVLSLSYDATTRYYEKCGSVTNKTHPVSETRQDASAPKVELTLNLPNNSECQKLIPAEIDARTNETVSKGLGNYTSHDNVPSIENVLAKESEQLAGVRILVKHELDKLSHVVTTDLKKIEKQRDSELSVDTILREIKLLEKREQNTKNTSEAREIHQVIDKVLGKLDAIEATEANKNIKLEEILKDLESNSNNSFVGLRQQLEEWKEEESRHLSNIKSKIEEHEEISAHPESYNRNGSNHPQPVIFNIDTKRDDVEPKGSSNDNTTQVKKEFDNNTSSRTVGESNDKLLISVANKSSSSKTGANESGLNDTAITINSYSTTESSIGRKIFYPFESLTTVGSSEFAILSTTLRNNLTRNNTNQTVTNTTLGITNTAPVNENIPPVDLDILKQGLTLITANEPITMLSTNENNSNKTMTGGNSLQKPEIKVIKDVILSIKRNTDSGKRESSDSVTNNDTVIISAEKTAETEKTSSFQSNNNSKDTVIKSTANTMVENTAVNTTSFENVESSTSATNKLVTSLATFDIISSNGTVLTNVSSMNCNSPVNVTVLRTGSNTATVNEESSTVTAKIISDNDSNNTTLSSTSSPNLESTPIRETIQVEETTLASGKHQFTTDLYDTKITSTSLPTVENTTVRATIQLEEVVSTSDNEKSSVTTKIISDNYSNNTTLSSTSSPNLLISETIQSEEITTDPGNEKFSNDSNGTRVSLPNTKSTLINKTNKPNKTTTATLIIVNENYRDTTISSTPTPVISTSESEIIPALDTTIVSTRDEESLLSTANSPTGTPNTANDHNDSSAVMVTMTSETTSESVSQENVTTAENYENLASTTNSPIASPATLIDPDSNTDAIISTAFPTAEFTTIEPSVLSTIPVTIPDEVTNEKPDSIDTVTNTTKNAKRVTEIIQTDEISTASEGQELSTSATTQSAIILTTSTVFPPTESIPTGEKFTASRNVKDLKNSSTLEANTSGSPESLNIPDQNFMVRSPTLTITESAPVNRECLTSNTSKPQINTNAPRNNSEFNAPISLSDRLLQTRQSLINPEVPMYGQAVPLITGSLFKGPPNLLTPDRLIPNAPNQQPKIENVALQQAAFYDSADKRLSHSESPFSPEEDILKIAISNIPSTSLITNAPRKPINPQIRNYENPLYAPKYPMGPPYSFGVRAPAKTYIPQGLTTRRPKKTATRANKYRSPPMNYDSFFYTPPRDSQLQQRDLIGARQLIANSKRSERIINSVIKNRNKFNARSVFG